MRNEVAYESIRKWLANGNLRPGEIISSYKLSESLHLSRTPITLALKKLEQEGFIEIIPQVGCMIKFPDMQEAKENFLIRAVLEGFATEIAALLSTQEDIMQLYAIYRDSIKAANADDAVSYAKCNRMLHEKIVSLAHMPNLLKMLNKCFWDNMNYQAASIDFLHQRHDISIEEHFEIIQAIEKRDAHQARALMEKHLRSCTSDFCKSLSKIVRTEPSI